MKKLIITSLLLAGALLLMACKDNPVEQDGINRNSVTIQLGHSGSFGFLPDGTEILIKFDSFDASTGAPVIAYDGQTLIWIIKIKTAHLIYRQFDLYFTIEGSTANSITLRIIDKPVY